MRARRETARGVAQDERGWPALATLCDARRSKAWRARRRETRGAARLGSAYLLDPLALDAQPLHYACRVTTQSSFHKRELVGTLYRLDLEVDIEFRPTEVIRRGAPDPGELAHCKLAKPGKDTVHDENLARAKSQPETAAIHCPDANGQGVPATS